MYKAIFCGDKNWHNAAPIKRELRRLKRKYKDSLIIIEGGAPGADQLAGHCARIMDIHVAEVKALWDTRHRAAGPQRNDVMIDLLGVDWDHPDDPEFNCEVVAFHENIKKSKGTKDCVTKARKAGVKTKVVSK